MTTKIFSCSFNGLNCQIIEVEADISQGLPSFSIVGLGDTSVQESKERIRSSIKNSGAQFPQTKKTINLAPAEIKKQGSLFDLPIAISLLLASQQIFIDKLHNSIVIGELSLNGKIKKINGALLLTQFAKEKGFKKIFLPKDNAKEASFISGIEIYPLDSLAQFTAFLKNQLKLNPEPVNDFFRVHKSIKQEVLLANVVGLEKEKRALAIAAAGGHNVLLSGPPGTGKTVLARAFNELLPQMSQQESLETTKIFSVAGLLEKENPLILNRPFREVHHTASITSIVGGGASNARPGEISLAHNGILFFDEITEFPRNILEALRQPLEEKFINITRSNFSVKLPSNFIFIATMNPCPCGYFGYKKCICTPKQIENYQNRLSGPILDRFDIFLEVPNFTTKNFLEKDQEDHQLLLSSIENAYQMQQRRFEKQIINKNSDMTLKEIREYCQLDFSAKKILTHAAERLQLSNRSYLKILKLARTIADLEQSEEIKIQHITEGLQYRKS